MRIFRKKFLDIKLLSLIIILIVIFIFSIYKKIDRNFKFEIINFIESKNLGFSSVYRLNKSDEKYRFIDIPLYLILSSNNIISHKLNNKRYHKLIFDINYEDHLSILDDKKIGDINGFLINPSFVNANVTFDGKRYEANVRLKGGYDHFAGYSRHSLRVKLKDNKSILGFKRFSLHKPSSRQYPYDYIFSLMNADVGNLASSHKFAKVKVNGQDWGIMNLEEHFDSSFLEKQKKKESIILSLGNSEKSQLILKISNQNIGPGFISSSKPKTNVNLYKTIDDWYKLSENIYNPHLFNKKKYLKNNHNRVKYTYASNQILENNHDILDQQSLIRAILLSSVWGSYHSLLNINSRLYFNPYTLKLEFIATDQTKITKIKKMNDIDHAQNFLNESKNYIQDFNKKDFQTNLNIINESIKKINEYYEYSKELFPVDKMIEGNILHNNVNLINYKNFKHFLNQNNNKKKLLDVSILRENKSLFPKHIYFNHFNNGDIKIYNLLPDDVKIKKIFLKKKNGIKILDKNLNNYDSIIPSYLNKKSVTLKTDFIGNFDGTINIQTEYYGSKKNHINSITLEPGKILNPLIEEKIKCNKCIKKIGKNFFFKKGNWKINNLLVLNGNLTIPAGTDIKFSTNSGIIINGSLNALGEPNEPIIMDALNNSWQGIYVYSAKKKSYLKNVIFKNLAGIDQGLLKLTGSINFYNSDIDISNVLIKNNYSEDAINIVNSNFKIKKLRVQNALSDGIDLDFSYGNIKDSFFFNLNGDAIDLSGSKVLIEEVNINEVRDKAISVGENSNIEINKSSFNKIGVGVASKDGSNTIIKNTTFKNYRLHSVMTYNKKNIYGPSSLKVKNSKFDNNQLLMRENGSYMEVDGKEIKSSYLDVKKLYKSSIMKK